jgi:hypothetical protein
VGYTEQQDITLEMVIKAGLLKPGTTVYATSDINITGTLNNDGSIEIVIDGIKKLFPYPSGAARAIRNISVSGWVFWKVMEDGKYLELLNFKKRFLELNPYIETKPLL